MLCIPMILIAFEIRELRLRFEIAVRIAKSSEHIRKNEIKRTTDFDAKTTAFEIKTTDFDAKSIDFHARSMDFDAKTTDVPVFVFMIYLMY